MCYIWKISRFHASPSVLLMRSFFWDVTLLWLLFLVQTITDAAYLSPLKLSSITIELRDLWRWNRKTVPKHRQPTAVQRWIISRKYENIMHKLLITLLLYVGRDSSVGIATRYGLDGPGIEFRLGRDLLHPSRPVLGPTQPPIQWVAGLSWG